MSQNSSISSKAVDFFRPNPWFLVAVAATAKQNGDDEIYSDCLNVYIQLEIEDIENEMEKYRKVVSLMAR